MIDRLQRQWEEIDRVQEQTKIKILKGTESDILSDGSLRRWAGSMTATLQAANLVATLNPSYYADPSLLWNAKPAVSVAVSVKGNQLTIQAPANATGSFQITVTASNGTLSASQTFSVSIQAGSSYSTKA